MGFTTRNVFLVFVLFCHVAQSLRVQGSTEIKSKHTLGYVGKFCYKYEHTTNFTTMPPVGAVDLEILAISDLFNIEEYHFVMYDDDRWNELRSLGPNAKCRDQLKLANMDFQITKSDSKKMRVHLLKEHLRPRWWFAFMLNCEHINATETIMYKAHFYQLHESNWSMELGANDKGLNTMFLFFTCFYFVLGLVQYSSYRMFKRDRAVVHQIVKLFTLVVALQFFSSLFHAIDWILMSSNGMHAAVVVYISYAFDALTLTFFMLMLLLLGQGWTISSNSIRWKKPLIGYTVFIFLYQVAFCVWRSIGFGEREDVKYFYDSPPMYFFGALMALSGIVFDVLCYLNWKNEESNAKKPIYAILITMFSFWFFMPLFRIFLAEGVPAYSRDIFAEALNSSLQAAAILMFVGLFFPSISQKYFRLEDVPLGVAGARSQYTISRGTTDDDDAQM